MLKILIVDDEPFFIDFLSNYINWEQYGAEVIGTAFNGLVAKDILRTKRADVVITDIKMPVMDGLELLCSTVEQFPDVQFIMLSSYNDFHMVQEAFKMGAKEYLLKSEITRDQLAEVLSVCVQRKRHLDENERIHTAQMDMVQNLYTRVSRMENIVNSSLRLLKKDFFNTAIDQGISHVKFLEEAKKKQFTDIKAPPRALMLVKICKYAEMIRKIWENNHSTFEFALINILDEASRANMHTEVFCRQQGEFILLIMDASGTMTSCTNQLFSDISTAFANYLSISAIVSVSSYSDAGSLMKMYQQAQSAGTKSFALGRDRFLEYDFLPFEQLGAHIDDDLNQLSFRFEQSLKSGHVQEIKENISQYQITVHNYKVGQIEEIKSCFSRYCAAIDEYLLHYSECARAKNKTQYFREALLEGGTLSEMNEWLDAVITILVQMEYNASSIVRRIKQIINERYAEELGLKSIASAIGMNPSYLSRVFSETTGEGLMYYINKIRVEASLELLKGTGMRLYEISEMVGYKNVEHYARMFKRIMGKSPREFVSM